MQQTPPTVEALQAKVSGYRPSESVAQLVRATPMVFVVGPSGAGKDTIQELLLRTGGYHRVVTHTTRALRRNRGIMEQSGREYHFIDFTTANAMLDAGEFVETNIYSGNLYGTGADEIRQANAEHQICLTDIDVNGVGNFTAISPKVTAFFIVPPSYEVWMDRLQKRYGPDANEPGNQQDLQRRLQTARHEFAFALDKPYFSFVVNDNLEDCVAAIDQAARSGGTVPLDDHPARQVARHILERIP